MAKQYKYICPQCYCGLDWDLLNRRGRCMSLACKYYGKSFAEDFFINWAPIGPTLGINRTAQSTSQMQQQAQMRHAQYKRKSTSTPVYYGNQTITAQWIPSAGVYECHFPFHETFIALIKSKVPVSDRDYDPNKNHAWYFTEPYFDILLPIMRAMFDGATFHVIDRKKVDEYNQGQNIHVATISSDQMATEFFTLLERAALTPPKETKDRSQIKKFYLRAARYYHPDFNPNGAEDMSRLNELWSNLTTQINGQEAFFK